MSVSLNPSTSLGFHRPLTELVKRNLTITNPNAQPVAFKVKTTAPKACICGIDALVRALNEDPQLYCVRPNAGRIEPGESVNVSVQLQPMKEEPPLHVKCKDKFLVQSTIITPEKENTSLTDIWSTTDAEGAAQVHQQKIRVTYLPQEGQTLEEEEEPATQPSRQTLAADHFETVRQEPSAHNGHAGPIPAFESSNRRTPPPERPSSPHADSYVVAHEEQTRVEEHHETRSSPTPDVRQPSPGPVVNVNVHAPPASPRLDSSFASAANVTADLSTNDVGVKLAEAQTEIKRLRALLEATPDPVELRRRRMFSDEGTVQSERDAASDAGTVYPEPSVFSRHDGASPQQVGIVALLVFIITYLFF